MSAKSQNLSKAKNTKNDEFYTKLSDIENELMHYKSHFKGKVVFCNCDDPYESNFFKYFSMNFNSLGLKKLIATSYTGSPVSGKELISFCDDGGNEQPCKKKAYKVVMTELKDVNNDGREDLFDVQEIIKHRIRYLEGDGDFKSKECLKILDEADIVVTNPPFSQAIDFFDMLMSHKKLFLIIGDLNWVTNKSLFHFLKDNEIWMGYTQVKEFISPTGEVRKFGNKYWFTNLEVNKRHELLDLYKKYTPEEFPKYANYDAIDVSKVSDIPYDYDGVMGVPISFFLSFNPDQFEILGRRGDLEWATNECDFFTPPSKEDQERFKKIKKSWRVQNTYFVDENGIPKLTFARIFIRKR